MDITVEGEAAHTGTFDLNDVIKASALEESIYQHRYVETWSMVIPWVSVFLADVLKRFKISSAAKYVYCAILYDPTRYQAKMVVANIHWSYRERLKMIMIRR